MCVCVCVRRLQHAAFLLNLLPYTHMHTFYAFLIVFFHRPIAFCLPHYYLLPICPCIGILGIVIFCHCISFLCAYSCFIIIGCHPVIRALLPSIPPQLRLFAILCCPFLSISCHFFVLMWRIRVNDELWHVLWQL